ncbi:MAG: hypothetical protein ACI8PW_001847 [Methylophilaceae bacterium]|jgi:hypothetical protein|uniref:Rap1a/Tai family immunity protein n=1 Tax=uncultured Paraglaciecola sp. TaxID=1765024 RepID=UPI0025F33A0B|nr:Rap1a/Tai family immunity protein [uncultured Paraglaciecola sp.]
MKIDLAKDLLMTQENKRSSFHNIARIFPRLSFTVLALQLMLIPTSHAVEILTSKELASHCVLLTANPEGNDGQYCVRYIQGFIDGAIATDARVMLNAENAITGDETFAERAIRTRMPGRVDRSRAEKLAGFCLGDPLPLRDVVDVVVADLVEQQASLSKDEPAIEGVYKSLMTNYPCTQ